MWGEGCRTPPHSPLQPGLALGETGLLLPPEAEPLALPWALAAACGSLGGAPSLLGTPVTHCKVRLPHPGLVESPLLLTLLGDSRPLRGLTHARDGDVEAPEAAQLAQRHGIETWQRD